MNSPRNLQWLNALPSGEVIDELLKCCGSNRWANQMNAGRPFLGLEDLHSKATRIWWSLEPQDWIEAFRSHPKIGENKAGVQSGSHERQAQFQKWSDQEQAGARNARPETINLLAQCNREYETKFGYIFIVCATGKSSEQMLALLQERLSNSADKELRNAAAEQVKITELRLLKLLVADD